MKTGLLNYLAPAQTADSKMGYGLLFLIGIFTSVQSVLKLLAGVKAEEIKTFDKKTIELQDGKQLIKSKLEINKYPNISVKKVIPV